MALAANIQLVAATGGLDAAGRLAATCGLAASLLGGTMGSQASQQADALRRTAGIASRLATASGLDATHRLGATGRLATASGLAAGVLVATGSQASQQANALRRTARIASSLATTGGLDAANRLHATSRLTSRLTAGVPLAVGSQPSQQANALGRTTRITGGFAAASGLDTTGRFTTTTVVSCGITTKQSGLGTGGADQTEQADRQDGGKDHPTLHWEGS